MRWRRRLELYLAVFGAVCLAFLLWAIATHYFAYCSNTQPWTPWGCS
jgi:hypothetical protein